MSNRDSNRMKLLALKLRANVALTEAEQAEWNRGATWRDRLPLLASKLRAGATLTPDEQAYWDQHANWSDKIAVGLPLTAREQEMRERAKEAITTTRTGGVLVVEAPSMTVEEWKAQVQRSRGASKSLLASDEHKNTT